MFPDNPIPRPAPAHELTCNTTKPYHADDTCFPIDHSSRSQEWSLSQIFGRQMRGTCPLTDPAVPPICLDVPDSRTVWVTEGVAETKKPDGRSRCFAVRADADCELLLPRAEQDEAVDDVIAPATPPLYAERSFTGHGQEHGGVQTILTNPSPDAAVEFIYMETLPWFMRIYLHTLSARLVADDDEARNSIPSASSASARARNHTAAAAGGVIQEVYYRPAQDRARGTQLEVRLRIPPAATVCLSYGFEKAILRYTEYPPDANRGFDVAAAMLTILAGPDGGAAASNLRTTSLLLSLPTPDFSMPYNVIIFTSTAVALAFGGMFNILVRRFVGAEESPPPGLGAVVATLRGRLTRWLGGALRREKRVKVD